MIFGISMIRKTPRNLGVLWEPAFGDMITTDDILYHCIPMDRAFSEPQRAFGILTAELWHATSS